MESVEVRHGRRRSARAGDGLELDAWAGTLSDRRLFRIHAGALGGRKALRHARIGSAFFGPARALDDLLKRADARTRSGLRAYRPATDRDACRAFYRQRAASDR